MQFNVLYKTNKTMMIIDLQTLRCGIKDVRLTTVQHPEKYHFMSD